MSDALTDGYKAERRYREFERYLHTIKDYVLNPDELHLKQAVAVAETIDWRERTKFAKGLENLLIKLIATNEGIKKDAWAKLLASALGSIYFKPLKEASPFRDKASLLIDYGQGFVRPDTGELTDFISQAIREKEMRTYDCDKYLVFLPAPKTEDMEIFWIDCDIDGIKGPRKPK